MIKDQEDLKALTEELQQLSKIEFDGSEISALALQMEKADELLTIVDSRTESLLHTIDEILNELSPINSIDVYRIRSRGVLFSWSSIIRHL